MNRRIFTAGSAATFFTGLAALRASASIGWCKTDPIVVVDGHKYKITASWPAEYGKDAIINFIVGFRESAHLVMKHKNETVTFIEADDFVVVFNSPTVPKEQIRIDVREIA